MFFRFSLKQLVFHFVIIFILSGIVGYLFGYLWQSLLLTSLVMMVWHFKNLIGLVEWLWQSGRLMPPEGQGVWSHVYDGIYRRLKRYRSRQKELNKKIRRFRDGAEALPDAAVVLGYDYTIHWCNKNARQLLGIRWPSDEGQRIDNLIRSPDFSKYLEIADFEKACAAVSPVDSEHQLEIRFMFYGHDELLLLARDVSQIKRLEEMRRDFVANVSHELKTPLTVVRGYVEMIQGTAHNLDKQWQNAFSTIEMQVTRMDRLVEQLLILSRVEVHAEPQSKVAVDMPQLIQLLIDDAKWLNQNKQHDIELVLDKTVGILGIESELKSACSNLIANAIAYTPAQGKIIITWQRVGSKMKFSVKDNGPGIKPEHINRLTERFYRVDKSRSRNTGGSGLGLAIVKHVLQHHGAELIISSNWGQGSDFSIYFDATSVVNLQQKALKLMKQPHSS